MTNQIEKSMPLLLHTPLIDWFTITSFEDSFHDFWLQKFREVAGQDAGEERKVLQYAGHVFDIVGGTGFIGTAIQKGVVHHMLRLSGYAAEEYKDYVLSQQRQGFITCTRVDVQVTVPMPAEWSQWDLLVRLREKGRITGWVESKSFGTGFQTVYVGARASERFTRVYVKKTGETLLLRYETEYKGRRARAVLKSLSTDGGAGRFLAHELQTTTADDALSLVFEPALAGVAPLNIRLKVDTDNEKTAGWLLQQVLPAFTRHINDHSSNGRVLAAFYAACKEAIDQD